MCTRIGIMVSGRLKCLGSCQHLKSKFGVSYLIEIRCMQQKSPSECFAELKSEFDNVDIEEEHGSFLKVKAPNDLDLSAAFNLLERMKSTGLISSYSLSQSTLEQIFIKFAAQQEEETGAISGLNTS